MAAASPDNGVRGEGGFRGIAFLHTTRGHIATFGSLMTELAPEIPVRHILAEPLLASSRHAGSVTPAIAEECRAQLRGLADSGARVVVCTCTTLGSCVDEAEAPAGAVLQRIDRAVTEAACTYGRPVTIAACLPTPIAPARALLDLVARQSGRTIDIDTLIIDRAWELFEGGDHANYLRAVAEGVRAGVPAERVVILAQASMAGATRLLEGSGLTVLSSPRPGVERAVATWRRVAAVRHP
jgi:hypothetical protein